MPQEHWLLHPAKGTPLEGSTMLVYCTGCVQLRKEIEELRKKLLIQEKLLGALFEKKIKHSIHIG